MREACSGSVPGVSVACAGASAERELEGVLLRGECGEWRVWRAWGEGGGDGGSWGGCAFPGGEAGCVGNDRGVRRGECSREDSLWRGLRV